MKKILYLLILLTFFVLLTPPSQSAEEPNDNWYPFSFPSQLDPEDPINTGKLVLDAPAGKHGFVKINGPNFVFGDGTPARFWGTNLCFNANFPSSRHAKLLADRIAYFGFNAVRLHHMDFFFEDKGIFEDINPEFKNPQKKNTGHLSKHQLDRLDYLIYLFKQRGIYVDINLLVSRHFTEADGVVAATKLGIAAKPASMFDPKLIELQKEYAKDLLTHYNPYTKTRYVDEPAVALIEITNENSLLGAWEQGSLGNLPNYYQRILDTRWNEWLTKKYTTVDAVKKAWAPAASTDNNKAPVILTTPSAISKWQLEQYQGAKATVTITGNTACIDRKVITDSTWHLQFHPNTFDLKTQKTYLITLTASADRDTAISLISQQNVAPFDNLGLFQTLKLTKDPRTIEIPFIPSKDCPNAKIGLVLGEAQGIITISNVEIREVSGNKILRDASMDSFTFRRTPYKSLQSEPEQKQRDMTKFYSDLQRDYFITMGNFLKKDLGIKNAITGIGGIVTKNDIATQTNLDFLDTHAYWDHPNFPASPWDKNNFRIHNKSLLTDQSLGFINRISKNIQSTSNKPYTVTQWNHCYPNQYAYETPLLLASRAAIENWDGLFQFSFSHGWEFEPELNNIKSYFDTLANPQQLILNALAGRIYLSQEKPVLTQHGDYYTVETSFLSAAVGFIKGKSITLGSLTLTPDDNGALVVIDKNGQSLNASKELILFAIGEIKNSGSSWNANGKFSWGKKPALFKNINKHQRTISGTH